MTKDELKSLVDHVLAAWGKAPLPLERTSIMRAWHQFMHDLDHDTVLREVNRLALSAPYLPRPGEIRVRVLLGDLPSGLEAWTALQRAREAINSGSDRYPIMEPIIAEFIRSLGDTAMGLNTNGDRAMFLAAFETNLRRIVESKCQVT